MDDHQRTETIAAAGERATQPLIHTVPLLLSEHKTSGLIVGETGTTVVTDTAEQRAQH